MTHQRATIDPSDNREQEMMMERRPVQIHASSGFAVLQFFVVVAIAVVLVALAVPVYAAKAKQSVLAQNAHSLALETANHLALGLDPTYSPSPTVAGAAAGATRGTTVSEAIVTALHKGDFGGSAGRYVNPLSGSRQIVNQSELPSDATSQPAVWVTNNQQYSYSTFKANRATRDLLRGTIVIVFVGGGSTTSSIQVFYVDSAGAKSSHVTTLNV